MPGMIFKYNLKSLRQRLIFTFILLACASATLRAQKLTEINRLAENGQFHEARLLLLQKESSVAYSASDTLLYLHALLSKDGEMAANEYEQLIRTFPLSTFSDDALLRLAQLKYAKGLYRTAKKQLTSLCKLYPQSPLLQQAEYWTGMCSLAMEQTDSASYHFHRVLEAYPDSDWNAITRSELDRMAGINAPASGSPGSASTSPGSYYVQVGAFADQSRAIYRKDFFEKEGLTVSLRTKRKEGQRLYLVWVGNPQSREQARALGDQLQKKYGISYTLANE